MHPRIEVVGIGWVPESGQGCSAPHRLASKEWNSRGMDENEVIPILATHGFPGDDSLKLRFPVEYEAEIRALLDEHSIEHGTVLEFSADAVLAIEAVRVLGSAGGIAALVAFYKAFVHRHDGKRVMIKRDGLEIEATGFSRTKTEEFLRQLASEQQNIDAQWREATEDLDYDGRNVNG